MLSAILSTGVTSLTNQTSVSPTDTDNKVNKKKNQRNGRLCYLVVPS